MFQLNKKEAGKMVSQNAIPSKQHLGGSLPYAFTEHGVLMLTNVLKSDQARTMSIRIIEIFVKLRETATYLSLYQLEIIPTVWEPFFGDGSEEILNSFVSKILPVPDAALGAFSYVLDAVGGILQPVLFDAWCTLCLASAGILGYNGIAADIDHVVGPVVASFAIIALSGCTRSVSKCNIPLGVWLVIAPWIFQYENDNAIANDIALGLLITGFSFIKRKTDQQYGGGWSVVWPSKKQLSQ